MNWFGLVSVLIIAANAFTTDLTIQNCDQTGCTYVQKRVALDATSNGTETFITVSGNQNDALKLEYGGAALGGPRVYLIEPEGSNRNTMFDLLSHEFTFDVELSTMPCGFNAALYFVGMTENEGGAESGTNYCDAQAVGGTFCAEMDIMEANTAAQQYTTHACVEACSSYTEGVAGCTSTGATSTVCDHSGCGFNPYRHGPGSTYKNETNNDAWYGFDSTEYELTSSQQFTVVTRFYSDSNTGNLVNITRFYMQGGNRIDLPTLYILTPTDGSHYGPFYNPAITEDYCANIYDKWTGGGTDSPLTQMGKNMENGMVLAMSAWYDAETYVDGLPASGSQTGMSWLDGVNVWGSTTKAGPCSVSTTDASGPHYATFSNIRFGDIGTTGEFPAALTTTTTTTLPHQCCYGSCNSEGVTCQGSENYCGQSESNCESCTGTWCTSESVVVV